MIPYRYFHDGPGDGVWNMALDEFLLELASQSGIYSLRIYSWREPTLSLGYFQPFADRESHRPSQACPVVRRKSGGGAILHDREITYSLTADPLRVMVQRPEALYESVHLAWIDAIRRQSPLPLAFQGDCRQTCPTDQIVKSAAVTPAPFLCFQRRSPWDVILDQAKVLGSAQRRRKRAILQHGSLLLGRSPAAPELAGLNDFAALELDPKVLIRDWRQILLDRLKIEPFDQPLADHESARIDYLRDSIFSAAEHTFRR